MKKNKHKYLLELYPSGDFNFPFNEKNYHKFDCRETYNYYDFFLHHLYEVLRYYQDEASKLVDFSFHKFQIHEEEWTMQQCIDKMIECCNIIILEEQKVNEDDDILETTKNELIYIFGKCFYFLWW